MKKIIMLETKQGSENGISVNVYEKDKVYIIGDELYNVFKKEKWCKDFDDEEIKEKKINNAPENKMVKEYKNKNKD